MFRAGQQIGIYTLISRIGRGGFGEVWLAERRAKFVTTKVAVKLPLDEQVDQNAIKQEATLWEQASGHPNILPIIDADEYDGQIVIVSEYAPGGSLDQWLKQNGKMPVETAVETTMQILGGLEFLHSRNIIHRDLKPANILLQGNTPRLADFGISRALRTTMTSQSQHISGTFAYMSPEALDGRRSVQTDIWAAGVNLYQFLTASLPFPQKEPSALVHAIIMRDFEPLPDFVPPELQRIIATALAKSPEDRYKTAVEMREDLGRFLRESFRPAPDRAAPRAAVAAPTRPELAGHDSADPEARPAKVGVPPEAREVETAIRSAPPAAAYATIPAEDGNTETLIRPATPTAARRGTGAAKARRLPFVVPAVALLLVALAGGYWLFFSGGKLVPFRKGNKFGYADSRKRFVIEPKYSFAGRFRDGLAIVALEGKHGFIDKSGEEVVPLKYDSVSPFSDGLAGVVLNEKVGFIDKAGREVVPPKYTTASPFLGGVAAVSASGKHGFIDKTGREVIPLRYDGAGDFTDLLVELNYISAGGVLDDEKLFAVGLNGKWGFVDRAGREVIPLKYEMTLPFVGGLAGVKLNGKCGFVDAAGREVIPLKYDNAFFFFGGLAAVKLNDKAGYIDKTGKEVIPLAYEKAGVFGFNEGLASVKINGKWGFIDRAGNLVIQPRFESEEKFDFGPVFIEGLALVKVNGKYGYIDKTGAEVIPPKYDRASAFSDGIAEVRMGENPPKYIDKTGAEYYEP